MKDLVTVRYGKALNASTRRPGGVQVVTSAGVTGEHDERLHDGPAIIVGRKGAVGRVTVVDGPVWTTDTAYYLLVPPELDARFLAEQLRVAQLHRLDQSTAVPSLLRDKLDETVVEVAPLNEQRRILALLEEERRRIDEASHQLDRAAHDLELLRLSVLVELGETGAPLVQVGDLGDVFVGATPKRAVSEYWVGGGVPWVSSSEVAFCRVSDTKERITELGLGKRETRLHPTGTVLLAMYGEGKTRGQAAILDIEAATNQAVAAVRLDPGKMLPEFLYLCFMRQYNEVRKFGRGGQQLNLNKDLVKGIEVPRPSVDVQRELVEHVVGVLALAEQYEADLRELRELAEGNRLALLREALSGRLTPPNPDDVPASELLQSIAAERERVDAGRPRRRRKLSAAAAD